MSIKEMELFESECKLLCYKGNMSRSNLGSFYNSEQTNWMYQMWLSSKNRDDYKLAPVEPTDHMKCVVRDFDPDIEEYANMDSSDWESLCSDIYKAMIGAFDEN